MRPLKPVDWALNKGYEHRKRVQRWHFRGGGRGMLLRGVAGYSAGLLGLWLHDSPNDVLNLIGLLLLAMFIVAGAMSGLNLARSYRDGWLDGHRDAIDSMPPMLRGDLQGSEWMRRQMAKELAAMGLGDPEALMCELDKYEAHLRARGESTDGDR